MIPALIIMAFLTEPFEPITQEPWNYVDEIETFDAKDFEQIERELERKLYRILEANPNDR